MKIREEEFLNIRNFFVFLSYIVELIILLLVNFILEKSFTYCTNVHSYFEKENKYISTYKSQCFKEVMILCWVTLIAVLGRMRPTGHGLDSPELEDKLN